MIRFIARRIFLETIPALLVIATITFFLIRLAPGGPFSTEKSISVEVLNQLNSHYGLDKPLLTQYFLYLSKMLTIDFGPSFKYPGRTVTELIAESFPVSLELGLYALIIALVLGILSGMIAASKPSSIRDYLTMSVSMTGICIPSFVIRPSSCIDFQSETGIIQCIWLEHCIRQDSSCT